jgi:Predicted membrane protein
MHIGKNMLRRITMVCIGTFFLGFSISLFVYANFGTDPYSCMNLGLSGKLGLQFGVWQLLMNCVFLVIIFFTGRHLIGIGTLLNMVFIGFIVDLFRGIYARILPAVPAFWVRVLVMAAAVLILSFMAALYMYPRLGTSPYDSIPVILSERTGIQFRWCRVAWDLSAVLIGWLCGSVVGVGTVLTALFLGPLIKWFTDWIAKHFPVEFED